MATPRSSRSLEEERRPAALRSPRPGRLLALDLSGDRARALEMTPVSRETLDRLDRFVETLLRWQRVLNLVGASTLPRLWTRHVADSLQLLPLAPKARVWVDFGSGGGFPGLVLGCALADFPGSVVHLVESNLRKAAFLREAIRASGAAALVHRNRVEEFVQAWDGRADVVTARAFAGLPELIDLAQPLLERGAQALFLKGQDVAAELTECAKYWNIAATVLQSRSDPLGRVVHVHSAHRQTPSA